VRGVRLDRRPAAGGRPDGRSRRDDRLCADRPLALVGRERHDRASALSAAAVGPLAHGDVSKFAALSAALALVSAAVLAGAGVLRLWAASPISCRRR
jgi:hypothetical protein